MQNNMWGIPRLYLVAIATPEGKKPLTLQSIDLFPDFVHTKEVCVTCEQLGETKLVFMDILKQQSLTPLLAGMKAKGFLRNASQERWIRCRGLNKGKESSCLFIFSEKMNGGAYLYQLSQAEDSFISLSIAEKSNVRQMNAHGQGIRRALRDMGINVYSESVS